MDEPKTRTTEVPFLRVVRWQAHWASLKGVLASLDHLPIEIFLKLFNKCHIGPSILLKIFFWLAQLIFHPICTYKAMQHS